MHKGIKVKQKQIILLPYFFIAPALILIAGIFIYPVFNVFYYSLRSYNVNKLYEAGFKGFDNFVNIFQQDKLFYSSLLGSARWVFSEVSLQLLCGLVIALVLNQRFRLRGIFRAVTFTPWAISGVLTSMMWSLMYNHNMGMINDLLLKLGIINESIPWTARYETAFGSLIVAELWRGIPFFSIIILAALQSIPNELYEACEVDGGHKLHKFIFIMLPYLKDTIVLSTLLRGVWEFNNVDVIYTLTGGGPFNSTTTLTMYITQTAIRDNDFGYGSALSVVAFLILVLFAAIYLKLSDFGRKEF